MTERLSSGSERMDAVLGGGLPTNAINLIIGPPGSGKTILAEQYLFCNATEERPGLFLSTVSEPFDKVLRYGESLTFFDADAIGTRVFYDDLGAALVAARHRGPGRPDRWPAEGDPAGDDRHRQLQGDSRLRVRRGRRSEGSSTTSPVVSRP